jgi:BTB/POZ domain-containing protein KCTD9
VSGADFAGADVNSAKIGAMKNAADAKNLDQAKNLDKAYR